MPLPFSRSPFAHCNLERLQLRSALQNSYGLIRSDQKIGVWVLFCGFLENGIEKNRVFLKMLRRSIQEMFEVESRRVSSKCLLS